MGEAQLTSVFPFFVIDDCNFGWDGRKIYWKQAGMLRESRIKVGKDHSNMLLIIITVKFESHMT
jgi:hypothetical protein